MDYKKSLLAVAISMAAGQALQAATVPAGTPLNQNNVQWQRAVAVASDGKGTFLRVWEDSTGAVWAQYSSNGTAPAPAFQIGVSSHHQNKFAAPHLSAAMNSFGAAVVAWGEDASTGTAVAQRLPPNSTAATTLPSVVEVLNVPDVAMDDLGNFAVAGAASVYEKVPYSYTDYYGYTYHGYHYVYTDKTAVQRFDQNGYALPVDSASYAYGYGFPDSQSCSAKSNHSVKQVTRNGGTFYNNYGFAGKDSGFTENLQRYVPGYYSPSTTFSRFTLDDYSYSGDNRTTTLSLVDAPLTGPAAGDSCRPRIAMNGTGAAVVTWANKGHIYARRYSATGQFQEPAPIQVDHTPADQLDWQVTGKGKGVSYIPVKPVVAMDSSGDFVVAWPLMKTSMKSLKPKDAAYEGHEPTIFKHELSASIKAQRFSNGAPTHLVKGVAADAELVKETERVDQDLSISISSPTSFTMAWANRFEDYKQFAHVGVVSSGGQSGATDWYLAGIKGNVFLKRFVVKNGLLAGSGSNIPVAAASIGGVANSSAFTSHWLPAIATDSTGNTEVLWAQQRHVDTYFTVDGYAQLDQFDSMTRYLPETAKK